MVWILDADIRTKCTLRVQLDDMDGSLCRTMVLENQDELLGRRKCDESDVVYVRDFRSRFR